MKLITNCKIPDNCQRQSISLTLRQNGVSQNLRRRLKREGIFSRNGEKCEWHTPLVGGDILMVYLPSGIEEKNLLPYKIPLQIIYEDEHFIIINKDRGLLVHPTSSERFHTLANALVYHYHKVGENGGFHPIHRLDKDTSGIVIVAKTPFAQHQANKQNALRTKIYLGIVEGVFEKNELLISEPIGRAPHSIIQRMCLSGGKEARTKITCLARSFTHSLLQYQLLTGRTHQIRVHTSYLGHPLVGDDLYGGNLKLSSAHLLHALQVDFYHPFLETLLHLKAPLPNDMLNAMIKCEIPYTTVKSLRSDFS